MVNPLWVEQADTNSDSDLANYTFALKGLTFIVFGKASLNGKVEAEIDLWRQNLKTKIQQNMGAVTDTLSSSDAEDETIIILPSCTESSQ